MISLGGSELPLTPKKGLRLCMSCVQGMYVCQVLNCPPGLGFSPLAIVPNITRDWVVAPLAYL